MTCEHDLVERETAATADAMCPLCMAAEIERLRAALKPFAACPWANEAAYPNRTSVVAAGLSIGDFRDAKQALEQNVQETK